MLKQEERKVTKDRGEGKGEGIEGKRPKYFASSERRRDSVGVLF